MTGPDRARLEGVLIVDTEGRAWGCMPRPWTPAEVDRLLHADEADLWATVERCADGAPGLLPRLSETKIRADAGAISRDVLRRELIEAAATLVGAAA